MSTTRKIKGWTDDFEMHPLNLAASLTIRANARPGDHPATLIIGGKAWTDDEVRAMVKEIRDYLSRQWDTDAAYGMMKIVAQHSIEPTKP